jgi:N-methylhydantoinase A/oxoprolinase/acetone carboxylase beta subunit
VSAACRYVGQSFELEVPFVSSRARLVAAFEAEHARRFGFRLDGAPVQCVGLLATATRASGWRAPRGERPRARSAAAARCGVAPVRFDPDAPPVATPLYERERLVAGMRTRGPAVVLEATATTVVEPGFTLEVDATGSLVLRPDA